MADKVRVAVVKVEDLDNPFEAVKEAVRLEGNFDDIIKRNSPVIVKPNWLRKKKTAKYTPKGMVTSPQVLESVIRLIKEKNEDIRIVESDTQVAEAEVAFERYSGYKIADKYGVKLVNASKLSEEELVTPKIPLPQYYINQESYGWLSKDLRKMWLNDHTLKLPKIWLDNTRISVPVIKSQNGPFVALSLSLKNLYGILPEAGKFKRYHEMREWEGRSYDLTIKAANAVLDICQVGPPNYAIVDGLWGLFGCGGPLTGEEIKIGVIIAGRDPVAVDTVVAELVGFNIRNMDMYVKAEKLGIGISDLNKIDIVGEKIEDVRVKGKIDVSLESCEAVYSVH